MRTFRYAIKPTEGTVRAVDGGMHETTEPIACRELHEGLTEYLDHALPLSRRQGFDAHLASCPSCRKLADELRLTLGQLASLPDEPMPPAMKRALLDAFRRTPPR
jgi:anti-sigma factor RsiW